MKDEMLQQIVGLIEQPTLLLNLPEDERLEWETALFDLAELLEDYRCGLAEVICDGKAEAGEDGSGQAPAQGDARP